MSKKINLMKRNLLKPLLFAFIFLLLANLVIADDFIRVEGGQLAQPQAQQAPAQQGGIPGAIVIGQSTSVTNGAQQPQPSPSAYNFILIGFNQESLNQITQSLIDLKIITNTSELDFDKHIKPYFRTLSRTRRGTKTNLDLAEVKTATIPVNGVQKKFLLIEGVQQNDSYVSIFRLQNHRAVDVTIPSDEVNSNINSIPD